MNIKKAKHGGTVNKGKSKLQLSLDVTCFKEVFMKRSDKLVKFNLQKVLSYTEDC